MQPKVQASARKRLDLQHATDAVDLFIGIPWRDLGDRTGFCLSQKEVFATVLLGHGVYQVVIAHPGPARNSVCRAWGGELFGASVCQDSC